MNDWNVWNDIRLKTGARQSAITHFPRVEKGNKQNSQERFLASKPTADSGDGTPNYKFPFFRLLTIGTIGTERNGGTLR